MSKCFYKLNKKCLIMLDYYREYKEELNSSQRNVVHSILLWSGILTYMGVTGTDISVIDFFDTKITVQIFATIVGFVFGGGLVKMCFTYKSLDIANSSRLAVHLSGVFVVLLFGLMTIANPYITSVVLLHVGLWHEVLSYRLARSS